MDKNGQALPCRTDIKVHTPIGYTIGYFCRLHVLYNCNEKLN